LFTLANLEIHIKPHTVHFNINRNINQTF